MSVQPLPKEECPLVPQDQLVQSGDDPASIGLATLPGDCFRACIGSIIGRPVVEVPHFALLGRDHSMPVAIAWLHSVGYCVSMSKERSSTLMPWCIASGVSPRNPSIRHAVVADTVTGEALHDPHPSRAGLPKIDYYFYFYRHVDGPNGPECGFR